MCDLKQSISIKAFFDNEIKEVTVSSDENIKKQICRQFNLIESKILLKINEQQCDLEDNLEKYFIQDQQVQKVEIFDINQLIQNFKEIQSLKNSQIVLSSYSNIQKAEAQIQTSEEFQQVNNSTFHEQDKDNKIDYNNLNQNSSIIQDKKPQELGSIIFEKNYICIYCQQEIKDYNVSTPCQHFFHYECLDLLIYNDLQQSATSIKCLCNQKLATQILNFFDQEKQKAYKNLLLQNQLLCIQKNYHNKIGRCIDNEQCKFWFIVQTKSQIHKKLQCFECKAQYKSNIF